MSEPIRILHILQRMEAGGTQALLMNIYRNIDRDKIQFDFLVEYPDEQFYDDEIKSLGGKIYYSTVRIDFNIFKFMKYLSKILNRHPEYKIIHVHTYSIGYFCLMVAKKMSVPVRIAHSHNNETVHDIKYLPKRILQKMYTIYATDLFACSEDAGKYLFKNKEYKVLKNAIDSNLFVADIHVRKVMRRALGMDNKFVVGHVGRFHPQKNHDFLLQVFKEIKNKKNNAELILIGTGPLEDQIKNKTQKMGISGSVHFLGNRKDVNRLYQAMDVFIFPSLFEGLGIVAIEAQAAGIPTVCSDGLPPEAAITPLYRQLKLSDNATKWADVSLIMANDLNSHANMQQYVIDAGFDMKETAKKMENYYIKKIECLVK